MKKSFYKYLLILVIFLVAGSLFIFSYYKDSNVIYREYKNANNPFAESTLTKNNVYKKIKREDVFTIIENNDLSLIFIGASWCPYCIREIGIYNELFKEYNLKSFFKNINYYGVKDGDSHVLINELNTTFGFELLPYIPNLFLVKDQEIIEMRLSYSSNPEIPYREQIITFFSAVDAFVTK